MSEPDYYRLLDANLNRVCEGLRVLEDWFRFARPNPALASRSKSLRHRIRQQPAVLWPQLPFLRLGQRDVPGDCGPVVTSRLRARGEAMQAHLQSESLLTANCKRIQEGLRSLEETCRLIGQAALSDFFEQCRYQSYSLEKMCIHAGQAEDVQHPKPDFSSCLLGLYGITMADPKRGRDHVDVGRALLAAGVQVLQYRNKSDDAQKQYEDCRSLAEACHAVGTLLIVNDRLDLALAVEADGVHLGQEDLPPAAARRIVQLARQKAAGQSGGKPFLIGLSTHNPGQAEAAMSEDIDYIGVGPIYATCTKADLRCPLTGPDYLSWTTRNIPMPQVAIGGISPDNLDSVLENGAQCCALISSIGLQDDITSIARQVHARILENDQSRNGEKTK